MVNRLGTMLKQARLRRGLSPWDLAARAGVSRRSVLEWEAGRRVPTPRMARLIARGLGVNVESVRREIERVA